MSAKGAEAEIFLCETENRRWLQEFLDELARADDDLFGKVWALLQDFAELGEFTEFNFKPLRKALELKEARIGKARVPYFYDAQDPQRIVCTHGFLKDSEKTQQKQINLANYIKGEYQHSKRTGNLEEVCKPADETNADK